MPNSSLRGAAVLFARVVQALLVAFAVMPLAGVFLSSGTVLELLVACIVAVTALAFVGLTEGGVRLLKKGANKDG